jgi:hypothetical protein
MGNSRLIVLWCQDDVVESVEPWRSKKNICKTVNTGIPVHLSQDWTGHASSQLEAG